ncbi:MAG: hypothetical protein AAF721_30050 [Myxococcota bacterium]
MDRAFFTRSTAIVSTFALALCAAACGDDGTDQDDPGGSTSTGGAPMTDGGPSGGPEDSTGADPADSSSGGGNETGVDSTGGESTGGDETTGTTGGGVQNDWGALVLGTLFTDDLAMAQMTHDQVAMGGQKGAMMAGDYGHDAMLGTTLLMTTENQFLGIDQWDNLEGAMAVYGDPKFQAAFGMLFAEPPSLELFERREDWHGWGSLEAADGGDRWFVVVRGTLAGDDIDASQTAHDMIAAGGEADAMAAGDVAHVVWVGTPEDPNQFFAVDVWTDDTNIETFYGNPDFQMAFGALFDAPPTIGVYASTDWHQW